MNKVLHFMTMSVLMVITFFLLFYPKQAEESFTYFPADPNASFQSAETTLTLKKKINDEYKLLWQTGSILDRKAYLRQDISLLYANGQLIGKIGDKWKQQVEKINIEQKIPYQESASFKAISFHHGELHENGHITSVQRITHDELYVVDSSFSPLLSFREAVTNEENDWKNVLDKLTVERIKNAVKKAESTFPINMNLYSAYLLTDLYQFSNSAIPGLTAQDTNAVIGRLWEGIYKNYFLGIKKKDGTYEEPIGSTIPVILFAKDKSHLIVISELKNGETVYLRQMIQHQ